MKIAVPDLALSGSALTLFWALFLYDGGQRLFRDSDTGWHIRTGESILATGSLPRVDPYSWSKPGETWFAWEWGADVLMGWLHRSDGLAGVAWLYLILIAACTWLWFRLHWVAGGDFLLACLMASPMLSTVNLHWLARPHVVGWVMLLVSLLWLDRLPSGAGWRDGVRGGVMGALWANLHASFFLLPVMAAAYASAHILRPVLWPLKAPPEHARAIGYLAVAGGAAAGTLVNPYGWNLHQHVAQYLVNSELLKQIGEFQTFNFHSEGALQILMTVALAGVGAVLALGQRNVAHFLLLAGVMAMALRSARALPLLALLLPLAGGAIATALRDGSGLRPALAKRLHKGMRYSGNLRLMDAGFSGLAWAPVLALGAWGLLHMPALAARTGFPPEEFPVAAAARTVAELPSDARILAPDKFGGYLIYRFAGQHKVFFDGRSDYYGLAFMRHYTELVQARPGAERHIERFGFTHALLPPNYSLLALLPRMGWREMYRDSTAVLLAAPSGTNRNEAGLK